MAVCSKCGGQVADNASFCGKCGQPLAVTPNAAGATAVPTGETGMAENVAGLFCYSLGWVTGLIFLLIDKRPFVRFHAAQSIVVFGALQVVYIVLAQIFVSSFFYGGFGYLSLGGMLFLALRLVGAVLWIFLMVKAYQGQLFRVPIAADIAQNLVKK
jgi:uncharacterized membrane protein